MQYPELATHQSDALRRLDNGKVLYGGVGSGKSRVAVAYAMEREFGRDIVVITTAKKRDKLDWETEAVGFGIGTETSVPEARGVPGRITVDSWNNIKDYESLDGQFFIFDEQRVVGSGAWVKSFLKITRKNRWILLSGTPGDTWLDYIPLFLANDFYKNRADFIEQHVQFVPRVNFPKVQKYHQVGKLVRLKNQLLVEMPIERHTTRHIEKVWVEYDKAKYDAVAKKRWDPFREEPIKDAAGYHRVVRRISSEDPSRLAAIEKLLKKHPKLIIFYNFDPELEELRKLKEIPWLAVAEYNGHKHEEIPDHPYWAYLVQYTAGAEGWNCIETDAMAFFTMTYSYKLFEQSQGRTDRMNTLFTDLYYYVLLSRAPIDGGIWNSMLHKRDFNVGKSKLYPSLI